MEGESFHPESFDGFVGQEAIKKQLQVAIGAARNQMRPMEDVLLTGPPGLGKTTLAGMIANALGDPFESYVMPIKNSALVNLVRRFHGVVLLDELHRSAKTQEDLLPLLQFRYIQLPNGTRLYNEWLTIIGATTEREKIIGPLYDRFVHKPEFDVYTENEMAEIVQEMSIQAEVPISQEDAIILGKAAGGTPRNARQLVLTARDLLSSSGKAPTAQEILALVRVDGEGLTYQHKLYLETLDQLGGQAGVKSLSMMLRLHETVIVELERLLIQHGYITYSSRGREMTAKAFAKNGKGPIRRVS